MGAFVIGVLVGWLAEWLFFTFWVESGSNADSADCASLESKLSAKNKELSLLKAELSKVASVSTTSGTTTNTSKNKTKLESAKKPVNTKKPAVKVSSSTKLASKKEAETKKPTEVQKKSLEKPKKATLVKKTAPPKKANKTTEKVAKKVPAKKASAKKITSVKGDDFTKLSGIGPSMSNNLKELGITSYEKLAAMDDDILKDMLEASGAKLNNNKDAMSSWNEQATMAAKGDFSGLKELQEALKKKT